jgi:N-acetylmuramoyl-L-alanine amidase
MTESKRNELYKLANIKEDIISPNGVNVPNKTLAVKTICIHDTENTDKGATASAHAAYMKGSDAKKRKVSWHYTIDDHQTIKHLKLNQVGFHAGSTEGNNNSIGIEMCVNSDGDFNKTVIRAAALTALLCDSYNISPDTGIKQHHFYSSFGKDCPHSLRTEHKNGWTWNKFITLVKLNMAG